MKAAVDFRENLKKQYRLCCNDQEQTLLADYLIDSLSDNGLLEISLEKLAEEYPFAVKYGWKRILLTGIEKYPAVRSPWNRGPQHL